jgi:hypothetical protein
MENYRLLNLTEEIQVGDEFQRLDGSWTVLNKDALYTWYRAISKPLTFTSDSRPVRRKTHGKEDRLER